MRCWFQKKKKFIHFDRIVDFRAKVVKKHEHLGGFFFF